MSNKFQTSSTDFIQIATLSKLMDNSLQNRKILTTELNTC